MPLSLHLADEHNVKYFLFFTADLQTNKLLCEVSAICAHAHLLFGEQIIMQMRRGRANKSVLAYIGTRANYSAVQLRGVSRVLNSSSC